MLCVLAYHHGDYTQAARLAKWIEELGGVRNHECMLVVSSTTTTVGVIEALQRAFKTVYLHTPVHEEHGWPQGPNSMWQDVARQISNPHPMALPAPQPWFWMEPDGVPLEPQWLDKIEAEYTSAGKPFMGFKVTINVPHMSGTGVYPPQVEQYTNRLIDLGTLNGNTAHAWDLFFAADFQQFTHWTNLIHDVFWKGPGEVLATFPDQESLGYINAGAVIFHRCKDSTLIDQLRGRFLNTPVGRLVIPSDIKVEPRFPGTTFVSGQRCIFTYFNEVDGIDANNSRALIELWKKAWTEAGWNPVVLGPTDAAKHPLFTEAQAKWRSFPCQNPRGYEMACFNRWLAMSAVGGGWMADYDLFPLNPDWKQTDRLTFFSGNDTDPLIPCLVYAPKDDYDDVIREFMAAQPTGDHFSDMFALRKLKSGKYGSRNTVKEYGEAGWEQAKAVHFSHSRMQGKMPKHQFIPELINQALVKRAFDAQPDPVSIDPEKESMRKELAELKALLKTTPATGISTVVDAPKRTRHVPMKKGKTIRTPEQIELAKQRMAKARAGRKKVAA